MIEGTVRTIHEEIRTLIQQRISALTDGICTAHGATAQFNYIRGYANHHPEFDIDENAMSGGVKYAVQTILDYLK